MEDNMVRLRDLLQSAGITDIYSIESYIIELWKQHLDISTEDRVQLIRETLLLYIGEDGKPNEQEEEILSAIVDCLHSIKNGETDTSLRTSNINKSPIESSKGYHIEEKMTDTKELMTSNEIKMNRETDIKENLKSDSSDSFESDLLLQADFEENHKDDQSVLEINEETYKLFVSLYPNINPDALSQLLIQVHGDLDRAIKVLDDLLLSNRTILDSEGIESSRPVCRHFLAGECLRHDCQYSHEIHYQTCRFWLENQCVKGENCEFLHGFLIDDDIEVEKDLFLDISPLDELTMMKSLNLQEFPSLDETTLSKLHSKPGTATITTTTTTTTTFADKAKLARIKEEFVDIDEMFIEKVYLQYEKDLEATRYHLYSVLGPNPSTMKHQQVSSSATATPIGRSKSDSDSSRTTHHHPTRYGVPTVWVATGESLREQYETIREKAITKANIRNSLFEQATQAYISGDKSRAATLSKQARLIDQTMRQLNHEAAELIFHERNSKFNTDTVIDLHGLHRDEALSYLEERIEHLRAKHYHGCLHIILGTGHHSKSGHGSRLLPTIERFLKSHAFTYIDSSKDKRGGMLSINID
jgi:DNA-nicking Smr family endonuclease